MAFITACDYLVCTAKIAFFFSFFLCHFLIRIITVFRISQPKSQPPHLDVGCSNIISRNIYLEYLDVWTKCQHVNPAQSKHRISFILHDILHMQEIHLMWDYKQIYTVDAQADVP